MTHKLNTSNPDILEVEKKKSLYILRTGGHFYFMIYLC